MKRKDNFRKAFNIFVLIFGILCIVYWLGMGFAVRFGQSLLWLWPTVGVFCIARYALVHRSIKTGRPVPVPRGVVRVFRVCLCVGLALFIVGEAVICIGAAEKPEPGADCIVVLGAKVNGTKPSGALAQRIQAAAEYLYNNPDTVCIASGGQGEDEGISEAQCIAENLIAMGIPQERIILEDKSTDTLSNIENSLALMPEGTTHIGIVTNDFHIFRALATARQVSELHFSGMPAVSTVYGFVHYVMREFFAVVFGIVKGELSF